MAEAKVFDAQGNVKESKTLDSALFNFKVKPHLLYEYVVGYTRNQRQGSAATKTRTMVKGGGRKPWRQKGTGRARAGTNNSPLWAGGGIIWGPHPKNYCRDLPKKLKRSALKSAFSDKVAADRVRIVDLPVLDKPMTKVITDFLKKHGILEKRIVLIYELENDNLKKSCRNIKLLEVKRSVHINPYDVIWAEYILITQDALQKIEEVFSN
ncbi:MAG: 50S ribosomal protein L4 [candidate division Zixibacteria bacterium 4484_95]|nr:MAG: 50S ribosomal protein L4 [candidate division Zixibacteria bacterium 4484_95]RKX18429.1 MAG: 50S ribosomal protein L4 [candidate division Zixibacteria bacterium]